MSEVPASILPPDAPDLGDFANMSDAFIAAEAHNGQLCTCRVDGVWHMVEVHVAGSEYLSPWLSFNRETGKCSTPERVGQAWRIAPEFSQSIARVLPPRETGDNSLKDMGRSGLEPETY